MVLRARKSLSRLSAFFGTSNGSSKKNDDLKHSHLIWILLASTSNGPQYVDISTSEIVQLIQTLAIEDGLRTIVYLKNTAPSCALSDSSTITAKSSPTSLLIYVDSEASTATSQKLRTLLEDRHLSGGPNLIGSLHWTLSTYSCIQFHEPKRAKGKEGQCIVTVAIDPATGQDDDVDAWYRNEHLALLSTNPIFLRCRRYSPIDHGEQDDMASSPRFLAVHEYTSVQDLLDHSMTKGQLIEETPWSRRVMDGANSVERTIWTV